jgi:hypothetical protein
MDASLVAASMLQRLSAEAATEAPGSVLLRSLRQFHMEQGRMAALNGSATGRVPAIELPPPGMLSADEDALNLEVVVRECVGGHGPSGSCLLPSWTLYDAQSCGTV